MRVAFIIRALGLGGAERQLVHLAAGLSGRGHEVVVLTFYSGLPEREQWLRERGVNLVLLSKRGRWDVLGFVLTLRSHLRRFAPDVVYSFLPSSNVIAGLVLPRDSRRIALVWGMRASAARRTSYDWLGWLMIRAENWLRALPDLVVANSRAGLEDCQQRGFAAGRLQYVPNGIDSEQFRFEPEARRVWRQRWPDHALVFGFAGRLDPMKGLEILLEALSLARGALSSAILVVAGGGNDAYVETLQARVLSLGLDERVHWLGPVSDMKSFYSAIDVFCLPSAYGEGTSNVIAEALACGCLCVATDIGDSAALIADSRLVARPEDPPDLLRALIAAVDLVPDIGRDTLRERVLAKLQWQTVVEATETALGQAIELRRDHLKPVGTSG